MVLKHNPTQNIGWVKRRFNGMLRDLHYALITSLIGKDTFLYIRSSIITADIDASMGTYSLYVSLRTDDMADYRRIASYLRQSPKNYDLILTSHPEHDTMPPCDSHPDSSPTVPQPATSATF
jgi:hypothetical protein